MKTIMTLALLCALAQGAWAEAQYINGNSGPMWEYDEGSETLAGSLIYSVDTDQGVAHVIGITGDNPTGTVVIPATYTDASGTDYPVTTIASRAFKDKTGLTSVSFPSVTVIAANAFEGCTGLTTLNLPSTLTSIGPDAFKGCTGLRSVVIDANVGVSLFAGCDNISAITFGENVTSICAASFQYLPGLTSVTISANVVTIGSEAFDGCANLSTITFLGETPPASGEIQFYGIASDYVMRVPTGSVDAYRAHSIWGNKAAHIECMPWSGSGTESDPYLISHKDELDLLAKRTGEGNSYEGMFFKLTADISYTPSTTTSFALIGTAQTPFAGTLDGDGLKVTVQFGSSTSYAASPYQALFSYVKGAAFRNLTVDGNIYTGDKFAGGLVGHSQGSCSFTNCHVSVAIASSVDGDGTHGGFVAHHDNGGDASGLTFANCIFDGKMLGEATHSCGGFVGYARYGAPTTFTNCLFAPSECTIGNSRSATFMCYDNRDPQIAKAYYTTPLDICQGNRIYTEAPTGEICSTVTAADGRQYFSPLVLDGMRAYYERGTLSESLQFTVSTADGISLQLGTDYTQVLTEDDPSADVTFTDEGTFALPLTLTAVGGGRCMGTHTYDVTVYSNWPGKGLGTEEDPYLVESASDLNRLMELITKKYNPLVTTYTNLREYEYIGKYFLQTADIDYTDEPTDDRDCNYCTHDDYSFFRGTYDGGNHTISGIVAKPRMEDAFGLFGRVTDGCIKNLTVTNSTFTSDWSIVSNPVYAGAIAGNLGYSGNGGTIDNCHVTNCVRILAGPSDYKTQYHGGIVGYITKGVVSNCTSAAHVRSTTGETLGNTSYFGGIAGINYQGEIKDCLYLGDDVDAYEYFGAIVGDNSGTLTHNFYYGGDVAAVGDFHSHGPSDVWGASLAVCMDIFPNGLSEDDYLAYGGKYYVRGGLLLDAADNDVLIAQNRDAGITKYTLKGRTLYKDGSWNTLCLPFDVTIADAPDLKGAEAHELKSADYNSTTGTLTLNFDDPAATIEAGKPYIVKLAEGLEYYQYSSDDRYYKAGLFDGNYTNAQSIMGTAGTWPVIFYTSGAVNLTGYKLYSGGSFHPTKWELRAKLNDQDDWTVIDSRDQSANPADAVPETLGEVKEYTLTADKQGLYRYFNLFVTDVSNPATGRMDLAEIELVGDLKNQQIVNPTFSGVTITATEPTATVCGPVTFQGTFNPVSITDDDKAKLYLGRGNTLYYPAPTDAEKPVTIGAQRAYFQLNGLTAGEPADPSAGVRAFNLNFGDEETGITTTDFTDSTDKSAAWYDLNGRKLSGKPTQKGIYINNGKKVIIK